MMIKKIVAAILILVLLGFNASVLGQAKKNIRRPKIGLVLSGGGARGFAHIGVLKVLEENRIPVDYIGGASMGALVAAMYAMNKTPDEMTEFIGTLDWNQLFQINTSFDDLSYRRKEDRRNLPAPVTLRGESNELTLPNALNSGHEIGLLLDRATLPYASIENFDDLPIPFRAVGTDMVNGDSVVLKSGSLSRALRATMSVPAVLAPVEIDGRLLADGGLVNNIPTDVVKAMGADILIVVNIEAVAGDRKSVDDLLGVLGQIVVIATAGNSRRSLREADFIIAPDLEKFSSGDFARSKEIIELGYRGAEQKIRLVKNLALDETDWQAHLAARRRRELPHTALVPMFVEVAGTDADAARTVREKLGNKYINQPLDTMKQDELAEDLSELTGTGRFDSLNYDLTNRQGQTGLLIRTNQTREKPARRTSLELGVDVNSVDADDVNFNFLARLTFFDVGGYGAEWRNDLRLGSNTRFATEYFRPLGRTNFFVAPRASYERRTVNVFNEGERLAQYRGEIGQAGIDLGYSFNSRSELRVGYTIGYENGEREIGDVLLPNLKGGFSNVSLHWTHDGLDTAQVPTRGILSRNFINYYFTSAGATARFAQAETNNLIFQPLGKRNIVFGLAGAGTTFGDTATPLRQFTLGGPLRLGGYGYEEFRGSNYANGGFGVLHNPEIFPELLGGKIYVGAWYEGGGAFEKFSRFNYRQSVSGGIVAETPLGPVFIGGGINEDGRRKFYFSFGRVFR